MLSVYVIVIRIDGVHFRIRRVDDKYYSSIADEPPVQVSRDEARVLAVSYFSCWVSRAAACLLLDPIELDKLRGAV